MSGGDDKPKPGPAVVNVFVAFREVDRIFDLHGHRHVLGTAQKPIPVTDMSAATGDLSSLWVGGQPRYLGEDGKEYAASKVTGEMPGVYQGIRIDNYDTELRTFARGLAEPIEEKFVYVFSSSAADRSDMTLIRELVFEKGGKFRLTNLSADHGKDEREATGIASTKLMLTVLSIGATPNIASSATSYYFLLAPYQLSWAALVAMQRSGMRLASRCARLFDWFWTDGVVGDVARNIGELQPTLKGSVPLDYQLYLVDALKEGVERAERYAVALEAWETEHRKLGPDKEYVLAKRIEQVTERQVDLRKIVENELGIYLLNKEADLRRRHAHALDLLADLLRWVGYIHRRDGMSQGDPRGSNFISGDTFVSDGQRRGAIAQTGTERARVNPYSEMVRDYLPVRNEAWVEVAKIVVTVIAKMNNLPAGEAYLDEAATKGAEESTEEAADAGSEMFFQFMRKTSASAVKTKVEMAEIREGFAHLLIHHSRHVVTHEGDRALEKLIEVAREKLAIKLNKVQPASKRKHKKALEKQRVRKIRNIKDKSERLKQMAEHYHLEVDGGEHEHGEHGGMSKDLFNLIGFAFETANLYYSLQSFKKDPSLLKGIDFIGSAADAYSATTSLFPKIKQWKIGNLKLAVLSGPIEILSGSIDFFLGYVGMVQATNFGQHVGHGMRTAGAGLTIVGTVLAGTPLAPVGIVLGIVGLVVEALGSWVVSQSSDWQVFLRHTRWGHRSSMDEAFDEQSNKNGFGYKGALKNLPHDLASQDDVLDDSVWAFKPEFILGESTQAGHVDLFVRTHARDGLGGARWTIAANLEVDRAPHPLDPDFDGNGDEDTSYVMSLDEPVFLATLPKSRQRIYDEEDIDKDMDRDIDRTIRTSAVSVRGTVILDVNGDNSHLVRREVSFDASYV